MPFPRKLLNEGEEVVLDLRPHWWFLSKPVGALIVTLIGLGLVFTFSDGDVAQALGSLVGVIFLGFVVWFLVRYARWTTTNFVVTTDRVLFRRGLIAKSGIEIPLDKINTVFFNQTIFERMLGAGDLRIESAGESGSETFSDIRKPSIVQNEIYKQMEANENRKFDRINVNAASQPAPAPAGNAPTQPAPGGGSIPDQLVKLDDLRKRGVISEEEFAAKKTELLKRM
jgi:uncharacterized membrane protein YdbT with pleckstrin-like domain